MADSVVTSPKPVVTSLPAIPKGSNRWRIVRMNGEFWDLHAHYLTYDEAIDGLLDSGGKLLSEYLRMYKVPTNKHHANDSR